MKIVEIIFLTCNNLLIWLYLVSHYRGDDNTYQNEYEIFIDIIKLKINRMSSV